MEQPPIKLFVVLLLGITVCIVFVDQPLALWINANLSFLYQPLRDGLEILETAIGYNISKLFIAYAAFAVGIAQYARRREFNTARPWIFFSASVVFSRLTVNFLKDFFQRPRPVEFLKDESLVHFFTAGNSFPSGHVVLFFGMYFPLTALFPKYKYPLLIIPVLVIVQRVLVTDHYISDTLASIMLALFITIVMKKLLKMEHRNL